MNSREPPEERFGEELGSLVEAALGTGASAEAVEERLQRAAQRARERRANRGYRTVVYECPEPGCESSYAHVVGRETVTCEVCGGPLSLVDSRDRAGDRILRFACEDGSHVTRTHALDLRRTRCSTHGGPMRLTESFLTQGSGGSDRA